MSYSYLREEQDLLEVLDLKVFGVKILVSILIEPFLATVILLDSCSCLVKEMYEQSYLIPASRYFEN